MESTYLTASRRQRSFFGQELRFVWLMAPTKLNISRINSFVDVMKTILLIGTGSAAGGICRYLVQIAVGKYAGVAFPAGILLVNLTGCFLIGLLYGLADRHAWMSLEWRLLLITGVCGGYTTFSTFSYDAILLLRQCSFSYFLLYVFGSVALGLVATAVGILAMR